VSCQRVIQRKPKFAAFIAIDWADQKHVWGPCKKPIPTSANREKSGMARKPWMPGCGPCSSVLADGLLKTRRPQVLVLYRELRWFFAPAGVQAAGVSFCGAEQPAFRIVLDAGGLDVFAQVGFELVMAGHLVTLAALLV
jgi:hypothetical protein